MNLSAFPRFQTESEEIRWWDGHLDVVEANLKEAIQNGMARRGATVPILSAARRALTGVFRTVSIRILEEDLDLARLLAEERGQSHQQYLASVLHEALAKRRRR